MHVLAVDDSLVDRKFIEKLLKISSFKVTVVESGTRALQYLGLDGEKSSVPLQDLKVNLIMTDYSMPGMTGYELLKKIKESSAFKEVPVVVMSSEQILPRINSCLEEGAEEFLLKPVKLSDVKRLRQSVTRNMDLNGRKCISKRKYPEIRCPISAKSTSPLPSLASCLSSPQRDLQCSSPSSANSSAKRLRL